ncbi:MAG: 30S ribosomal protein S16 [Candidatus Nomurabacteria bacterium]|jgi:small subunit ribosomal protein S16|nr:30S ribosomal protein S16 [Candidatus Nomurabacteria bacterium]
MLAIRLQRIGHTHYATYRIIVQDSAKHPTSGRIVAYAGSYNPHTKQATVDKEIVEKYLSHGAQPSDRVIKLLTEAKIKLPSWVKKPKLDAKKPIRNIDKLRRNRPAEPEAPAAEAVEPTDTTDEAVTEEKPAENAEQTATDDKSTAVEKPTEAKPEPADEAERSEK